MNREHYERKKPEINHVYLLRALKEDRGWSFVIMARKIRKKSHEQVSASTLKRILLRGDRPKKRIRIAIATGVDLPYRLLWGEEND